MTYTKYSQKMKVVGTRASGMTTILALIALTEEAIDENMHRRKVVHKKKRKKKNKK